MSGKSSGCFAGCLGIAVIGFCLLGCLGSIIQSPVSQNAATKRIEPIQAKPKLEIAPRERVRPLQLEPERFPSVFAGKLMKLNDGPVPVCADATALADWHAGRGKPAMLLPAGARVVVVRPGFFTTEIRGADPGYSNIRGVIETAYLAEIEP